MNPPGSSISTVEFFTFSCPGCGQRKGQKGSKVMRRGGRYVRICRDCVAKREERKNASNG